MFITIRRAEARFDNSAANERALADASEKSTGAIIVFMQLRLIMVI